MPDNAVTVTNQIGAALIEIASGPDPTIAAFQVYRVPPGVLVDRSVHLVSGLLASTPSTTLPFNDIIPAGSYEYYVEALDAGGNAGALAGPFDVTVI